jgi:hypothetical protein
LKPSEEQQVPQDALFSTRQLSCPAIHLPAAPVFNLRGTWKWQNATYSKHELGQYFDRICTPTSRRVYDVSGLPAAEKLAFLNRLQKHHRVKVPWENLVQHYSWHKVVNVKPRHLFREIVGKNGRGGYFMQVN